MSQQPSVSSPHASLRLTGISSCAHPSLGPGLFLTPDWIQLGNCAPYLESLVLQASELKALQRENWQKAAPGVALLPSLMVDGIEEWQQSYQSAGLKPGSGNCLPSEPASEERK
mgnify:CR=1 FL=1